MADDMRACIFCRNHDMHDECWHSPEYEPVAAALARAVHGDDTTDEQVGWFVDDAEQIGGDLWHYLGRETPLTARGLGFLDRDPDRYAYLFNGRIVVTIQGSNDGSGETITEVAADLGDHTEAEQKYATALALLDKPELWGGAVSPTYAAQVIRREVGEP